MSATVKARTARIAHLCDGCHWTPSLRGQETIAPGHRYFVHTAFPGDDANSTTRPFTNTECVSCAVERGQEHLLGACLSYCCGDVPCAKPNRHDGNHSCRRCMAGTS